MATHTIGFRQFFAAPREPVFAWFAKHENVGQLFYCGAKQIRQGDQGQAPNGVGSARIVQHGPIRLEQTITRFEPPALIEYQGKPHWPIGRQTGWLSFESVPGGTQLEYRIEYDSLLPFSGGLLTGLLTKAWRRGVQRAVEAVSVTTTPVST